ncbi:sugar nucleotide-binding protein [Bdellovibrionota bacterium FG-1]
MSVTHSVWILGGSSFVGSHLALAMREKCKVTLTYYGRPIKIPGVTSLHLALDNRDWAKRIAYLAKPDTIIYAAGSNNVAAAEADPHMSDHLHIGGAATMADVTEIMQPKFIYLSNCFVFDGLKGNYRETDTVIPAAALGSSKVGGENYVRGRCLNYMIVRSSPLIGRGNGLRTTFFDRIRTALDRGERFELPNHESFSYAPISGLVDLITRLVEGGVRNRVLHYGGLTRLTPYEWAVQFATRFGYNPGLIVPARAGLQKKDFSLNCSQAIELLKIKPLLVEESFDLIEKQLIARP